MKLGVASRHLVVAWAGRYRRLRRVSAGLLRVWRRGLGSMKLEVKLNNAKGCQKTNGENNEGEKSK